MPVLSKAIRRRDITSVNVPLQTRQWCNVKDSGPTGLRPFGRLGRENLMHEAISRSYHFDCARRMDSRNGPVDLFIDRAARKGGSASVEFKNKLLAIMRKEFL